MEGSKPAVLLVDDRPDKLLALEAALDDLPLRVIRAYSGAEALRQVLAQEFAVILLDINMPNMDGFETAQMIRQRRSSAHVPIIFLTAMGDEMYAERVYSLGAVDYILTPVVPQVLRSKVSVFVDLFKKTQQVQMQAERLRQRAVQLHRLTEASLAINSAQTIEAIAQIATDTAREVIGCNQAVAVAAPNSHPVYSISHASYSPKLAKWEGKPFEATALRAFLASANKPMRMTRMELEANVFLQRDGEAGPSLQGLLAAPLSGRDGRNIGSIYLSDRYTGEFTDDDQAILVQLAQLASVAMENIVYAQEREANRFKDEFLATLSHELRTPLNAISGWIQLLRFKPLNGDVSHGLDVIDRNVKSQTRLIEDLLDLSRIANGQLRLQTKVVTIQSVIEATVETLRPVMDERKIKLHCDLNGADKVLGDPDRLQQVFWNLLTNSAKFTPAGGSVTVRTDHKDGALRVSVSDTGDGIDADFLPRIFDRFRQADTGTSRRHGGLGIGLTIVRCIVELHGGTIAAESAGKGRGSTFNVKLPLASAQKHAPETAIEIKSPRQPPSLKSVSILLVDDDADAREVVGQILQKFHAKVATAASADEALEQMESIQPDVLVTDLAMPRRDGYALLDDVRRNPWNHKNIPAIALTAFARPEDRARTRAAGFQEHVPKPIDPDELIAAIHRCAQSRRAEPAYPA
jgi:signal transduction histidine kinase/DNA-binding response OmpR family regulator